jgi:hypothetical protein
MKVTLTNGKVNGDHDNFNEDDVYGLDGGLIGRNHGLASEAVVKADRRPNDQATVVMVKEASPGGLERDGARGIREHDLSELKDHSRQTGG